MGFTGRLSTGVKRHMGNLKRMYNERVAIAEAKARQRLADAKSKTEKEKIKLQLKRETMQAKKELYEAQVATKKAEVSLKKARKEAGDLTIGERLGQAGRSIGYGTMQTYRELSGAKKKKRTTKRKTARK